MAAISDPVLIFKQYLEAIEADKLRSPPQESGSCLNSTIKKTVLFFSEHQSVLREFIKEHEGFTEKLRKFFYRSHKTRLLNQFTDPNTRQLLLIKEDATANSKLNIDYLLNESPDKEQDAIRARIEYEQKVLSNQRIAQESRRAGFSARERVQRVHYLRQARTKIIQDCHVALEEFRQMVDAIAREVERREKAEQIANELMAVDSKKPKKKNQKKAKTKRRVQAQPKREVQPRSKEEAAPLEIENPTITTTFDGILKARKPLYTFASRVRRWEKANADTIRTFVDSGQRRYAKIEDDEELLQHRRDHNTSGLEFIFCDDKDRHNYTFSTTTGLGMMASMRERENEYFGIIYFGIDANKVIYHRQFIPLKEGDTADSIMGLKHKKLPGDSDTGWIGEMAYTFYREEENTIRVKYDEGMEVLIYPIEKKRASSE